MNVLLFQLDGKLPNVALMRISQYHRGLGDAVTFRRAEHVSRIPPRFGDSFDQVYASSIFSGSIALCNRVLEQWPGAIVGGTGFSETRKLEDFGIATDGPLDYDLYPKFRHSIGFSQRGCRLRCSFCLVPRTEGKVRPASTIAGIWRGSPHPKNLLLLDNDFFGQPDWAGRIEEIRAGGFKVSFSQGINARFLTPESAAAIASVRYSDDDFKSRCIYTAWDNKQDEARLMAGLQCLVDAGVKPDHIMVYILVGYWPGETHEDRDYRRRRLREFGARPYPMPFIRTPELVGFQRWVVRRADLKMSWEEYTRANYRPERVKRETPVFPLFDLPIL